MSSLLVHHFGPEPGTPGGMATVITLLTEHNIGGDSVDYTATWRPRSPLGTACLAAASVRTLLRFRRDEIVHIHLSERGSFLREGLLVMLSRRRGFVTVATIHGAAFLPFARSHRRLVSAVLKRAHLVICLEQRSLDFVRRVAPAVRSEIVPNPVFVDEGFLPADKTEELVVFAGEVGLRKGADVLCDAWRLVAQRRPRARCLIVGPKTKLELPEIDRLEVRGPVDAHEMHAILRRARVIVLPSRADAMPMVLVEAMSLGRPFVATPVGAIPELARGGGVLVAVNDQIGLAHRVTELLAHPNVARQLGEKGRHFCQETRSAEVVAARLRELYVVATDDRSQHLIHDCDSADRASRT